MTRSDCFCTLYQRCHTQCDCACHGARAETRECNLCWRNLPVAEDQTWPGDDEVALDVALKVAWPSGVPQWACGKCLGD